MTAPRSLERIGAHVVPKETEIWSSISIVEERVLSVKIVILLVATTLLTCDVHRKTSHAR
jgi:hypothetical protein